MAAKDAWQTQMLDVDHDGMATMGYYGCRKETRRAIDRHVKNMDANAADAD